MRSEKEAMEAATTLRTVSKTPTQRSITERSGKIFQDQSGQVALARKPNSCLPIRSAFKQDELKELYAL